MFALAPSVEYGEFQADYEWASGKIKGDLLIYYVFHILAQIYTADHATFPVQMYAITV